MVLILFDNFLTIDDVETLCRLVDTTALEVVNILRAHLVEDVGDGIIQPEVDSEATNAGV